MQCEWALRVFILRAYCSVVQGTIHTTVRHTHPTSNLIGSQILSTPSRAYRPRPRTPYFHCGVTRAKLLCIRNSDKHSHPTVLSRIQASTSVRSFSTYNRSLIHPCFRIPKLQLFAECGIYWSSAFQFQVPLKTIIHNNNLYAIGDSYVPLRPLGL